ncbi:MAG: hypothetical protein ABSE05_05520 [Syntrophales bacterium]|jgi:hypothetical protein
MTAEGIKTTDVRAGRVDAATLGIEEDAGAVFFPIQKASAVVGAVFNELGSGQAPVRSKARHFVRVDLDFLGRQQRRNWEHEKKKGVSLFSPVLRSGKLISY